MDWNRESMVLDIRSALERFSLRVVSIRDFFLESYVPISRIVEVNRTTEITKPDSREVRLGFFIECGPVFFHLNKTFALPDKQIYLLYHTTKFEHVRACLGRKNQEMDKTDFSMEMEVKQPDIR
jgi:hypothetical protein